MELQFNGNVINTIHFNGTLVGDVFFNGVKVKSAFEGLWSRASYGGGFDWLTSSGNALTAIGGSYASGTIYVHSDATMSGTISGGQYLAYGYVTSGNILNTAVTGGGYNNTIRLTVDGFFPESGTVVSYVGAGTYPQFTDIPVGWFRWYHNGSATSSDYFTAY